MAQSATHLAVSRLQLSWHRWFGRSILRFNDGSNRVDRSVVTLLQQRLIGDTAVNGISFGWRAAKASLAVCVGVMSAFVASGINAKVANSPSISFSPTTPKEYEPFKVRLLFSVPVCFSINSPVYSKVSLSNGILSLALSHLKPGPCVSERILPLSGLPRGSYSIRLTMTSAKASSPSDPYYGGSTVETELAVVPIVVAARPELDPANVYTARIDGDSVFKPFTSTEDGGGPVVLWSNHGEPVSGGGDWLDVGSPLQEGYTFKAMRNVGGIAASELPAAFEPLFVYRYPTPLQGVFAATTNDCLDVVRIWLSSPSATTCGIPSYFVLKYKNGSCPLGATPVFRLFHPGSFAHRYTQSAETYSELQNYGYVGDGPVFCAPFRQ